VDPDTPTVERSYFDSGRLVRYEDADEYGVDLAVFHETVGGIHGALRDAGFVVETLLEPGSPAPEDYDPGHWGDSPPELGAKVPRCWSWARSSRRSGWRCPPGRRGCFVSKPFLTRIH